MSWFCTFALRSMVSMARATVASSRPPVRSMCAQPTIALSGVRSSWESMARNSSFIRLASRASSSRRVRSASAARRSEMSRTKALNR